MRHAEEHARRVSPDERRWELGFGLLVMLVTTLPYGLAYLQQGSDWVFTGFLFGAEDGNSYVAKMLAGSQGAWLFRTPYTAMEQGGVLLFLPYLLLGKLAAPPDLHLKLALLLHAWRWAAGLLAVRATHDFLAWFLPDRGRRRFGLALAVLGGGLGWLLVAAGQSSWLGSLPLEFYSPETFGFLGIFGFPHLALARALLLWALLAYLCLGAAPRLDWRGAAGMNLLWLGAALCQPLAGGVIGLVILAHLAVGGLAAGLGKTGGDWSAWRGYLRAALAGGGLPTAYVLYFLAAQARDPFLQVWTAQNIIRSPHPLHYLLAYGLVLPFAVAGARALLRQDRWNGLFLAAWAGSLPLLAYAPLDLQRRLPEGIWAALVALALSAHFAARPAVHPNQRPPYRSALARLPLWLCFPSTLFFVLGATLAAARPAQPLFRPLAETQAFVFLSGQAEPGALVLGDFETGNALPAWAPLRVVIGHGPESAGLAELAPQVQAVYQAELTPGQRLDWLQRRQVRYVFWGPAERALGDWDPAGQPCLDQIYARQGYEIYEVVAQCN